MSLSLVDIRNITFRPSMEGVPWSDMEQILLSRGIQLLTVVFNGTMSRMTEDWENEALHTVIGKSQVNFSIGRGLITA